MKKFNLAALPLAVAGVFASTSAFAGTEACFEVYRVAAAAAAVNHDVVYDQASCIKEADRTGAAASQLEGTANGKVAWELTGDYDVDFETLGATLPRHHIIYIPTSQLSASARITMMLDGADFGTDNNNQIFLVMDNGTDYVTVATSDGDFSDGQEITFIVGNSPVPAGTRLMLSTLNPSAGNGAVATTVAGVNIHLNNDETCTISPKVTIAATKALSDAQQVIAGAISKAPHNLLDISEQFSLLSVSPAAYKVSNEVLVDAEEPSERTNFVNNGFDNDGSAEWDKQVTNLQAFWEMSFTNQWKTLDAFVTLSSDDDVSFDLSTDSSTGSSVSLAVLVANATDAQSPTESVLDETKADYLSTAATSVPTMIDFAGTLTDELPITEVATTYTNDAEDYFYEDTTDAASTSNAVVRLTNTIDLANDIDGVMDFNYSVTTKWSMDFNDSKYLDKNGCVSPKPFVVGVNGAVLKVPYVYTKSNEGGFVRITSEHTTEANVFMDIFDESSNEMKNVKLANVAPKASNVLKADDLLAAAIAAGYTGTGDRHTMTFTVTAPKNRVHGVSVQKIAGGLDRVMPVLDTNDWSQ